MATVVIGCGRMGSALLNAALRSDAQDLFAYDPALAPPIGVRRLDTLELGDLPRPLTVVAAVKPEVSAIALAPLKGRLCPADMLISVMAGVTIAGLQRTVGTGAAIVRAMPNIGMTKGVGATPIFAPTALSNDQAASCNTLFGGDDRLVWLASETMLHAATAISGSAPAYFLLMAEHLAGAGRILGLGQNEALILAANALVSAGALVADGGAPEDARERITSPKGTTAAAVDVFQAKAKLERLIAAACLAAARRSEVLSES